MHPPATVGRMGTAKNSALLRALAVEIKAQRARLGISQDELALRSGLSRTFIGRIEVAQNQPTITALFKLAEGLEISAVDLVKAIASRRRREE